jgi:UDP:flavonoid glycosyltransferase YjiC (YdhE family)
MDSGNKIDQFPTKVKSMKNKLNILMASAPADGHFNPLTGIAKHLEHLGHDVRWYATTHYEGKVKKLQMPFYPFTIAKNYLASNIDTDFPERATIKNPIKKINWDIENFFIARGPEYLEDMKNIHKEFPFDVLICDNGFTGAVFAKYVLNVKIVVLGVLPLTESSRDLAPYGMGITPAGNFAGKLFHKALRWLAGNVLFKRSNKVLQDVLDRYAIPHDQLSVFDLLCKKADILLQSGSPSFEYKRSDLGRNVRFIGALLPYQSPGNKKQWFADKISEYKNIVLVTQGTVEKDVTKLIVPALEAFKNDQDTLLICTTGGSQTAQLKKQYNQHNIIIEDFIPFKDVMPFCDAYISNGGYGGIMLGIEHKLPLVVAGVHEGKNEICARVGYFNYGINLKTERPTPVRLRKAVNEVIMNTVYRKNIEQLSEELETYQPNELVEQYVYEVVKPKTVDQFRKQQPVAPVL